MAKKITEAAIAIALIAAAAGELPRLVAAVRVAQLQLIKDSQSTKWGRAMLLPVKGRSVRHSR